MALFSFGAAVLVAMDARGAFPESDARFAGVFVSRGDPRERREVRAVLASGIGYGTMVLYSTCSMRALACAVVWPAPFTGVAPERLQQLRRI